MTEKDVKRVSWFLWPFAAVWELLATVINITGRLLAATLSVVLMAVGIVLTVTIVGAPLGVPFIILGLLLMIRSIF
jgi:hypothetical protein